MLYVTLTTPGTSVVSRSANRSKTSQESLVGDPIFASVLSQHLDLDLQSIISFSLPYPSNLIIMENSQILKCRHYSIVLLQQFLVAPRKIVTLSGVTSPITLVASAGPGKGGRL